MSVLWKKLLVKLTIWVVAEILLTMMGLDNLADYSEYIECKSKAPVTEAVPCFVLSSLA